MSEREREEAMSEHVTAPAKKPAFMLRLAWWLDDHHQARFAELIWKRRAKRLAKRLP